MKIARSTLVALASLILLAPHLFAQEKPASNAKSAAASLKLQVTIAEQEGEKKVASLPYTFFLRAGESAPASPWTKVRMGSRVPVHAGKEGMQYLDVGTNIDARAIAVADGHFDLSLNLERSWVEGEVPVSSEKTGNLGESNPTQNKEPIIRQFKTELTLSMRDAQTVQTTQASDPLSGRILTITVTMNVVK
jgi:hypothetical protein